MSDRRAERPGRGTLGVDVDPLVVAGRLGERVDLLLRHVDPRGRAELCTWGQTLGHVPQRTTLAAQV